MKYTNKKTEKLKLFIIILLIFNFQPSIFNCLAQSVQRERTFTSSGLYGFMNGGADQFLEYGVQKLTVRDATYKGEEYTIEIYEMASPEDAFGIYSLHTFKCDRTDTLGCIDCLSSYQLQAVSGNKYVSVVFPSGTESAKKKVDEVIRIYVPMDAEENPDIPGELGIERPYSGNLKYLKGPLSLSTTNLSLAKLMENIPYTGIWFVSKKPSKEYNALILCDEKDVKKIKEKIAPDNIVRTGDNYVYISGTDKEEEEEDFGVFGF